MGRYLLRRLAISIPVLIGITIVTFTMVSLAPGDPVSALISPEAAGALGPEWVEQQREKLGLNKPVPVRYLLWGRELIQGNFGFSTQDRQPVADKIVARIGPTLRLMGAVQLISILIAVPVGVISALRQYSILDYLVSVLGFTAISIPSFFLALAGIFIFGLQLEWLPTSGMRTVGEDASFVDSVRHLILPAFVLGLTNAAPLIRYVRSSMLEVIHQPYVNVARSKGLSERAVVYGHAARNALIPLITVITLGLPGLIGGTVIIETIFAWPGMGQVAIAAVRARDYPMIMALNLMTASLILSCNLLADVLYATVDPRIKYS
ncbi:MAG: peptide/nickel transport system permease protein [Thermomicrobiales bacterium]|nr:peptide/nickel transport system permease protein [Thermomicrobiales bacterium]MEA2529573.1 peptide/nickel transport system permease protein [Thermomicrobiales bacterium]MEA2595473.1 peptide/nickel transport system permease protein [Thermomicrobiales bacterium]